MNKNAKKTCTFSLLICMVLPLFYSCGSSVRLTASWSDSNIQPAPFSKILVLAIGKDLEKRRLGEEHIVAELHKQGFAAAAGIDEYGPDFAGQYDSTRMRGQLLAKQFDGVVTVRVLNIDEHDRWMPGSMYYGPMGFYRGFYGYYYRVWGYYREPGYTVTDVEVLLESNLYRVETGDLLWSGQSKAFSRDPTPGMADEYAKNIVKDMIRKGVLRPTRQTSGKVAPGSQGRRQTANLENHFFRRQLEKHRQAF